MKKILFAISLMLFSLSCNAGPVLEQWTQYMNAYLSAQAKHPNRLIKHSDPDPEGLLVRMVLGSAMVGSLSDEVLKETNGKEQLKAAIALYKPIALSYQKANTQLPGQYEAEQSASFWLMFRLLGILDSAQ